MKPAVAIVGRPNVGKSALFNRLVGRRVAIVHDLPGVTRDRVSREAVWEGRRIELIDTGGLGFIDGAAPGTDELAREAKRQAEVAIEDAALILFAVDVTAGVLPLDEEVARQLHRSGRPVLVLANKADHEGLDEGAQAFARLGFPVYPVAALHNRGFDVVRRAVLARLPESADGAEPAALKVAVVGRPNAGKSSYVNRLLRSDRVIVSPVPGTTRDSVEIPFQVGAGPAARHYLLIDTAGMRARRKVDTAVETFSLMRAQESIEACDVAVLVLDGAQGPSTQDKKIAARILEARKGCVVLVNKWDLLRGFTEKEYETSFRREVPFLDFAPLVFVSAQTGQNVRRSIETIDHVAAQIATQVPTATLNRVLHDAVQRVQPPLVQGKRLKLYYATQTGVKPVRVRLFVNDPLRMTDAYRQYLVNSVRRAHGLEGAPVLLEFRSSHDAASRRPPPRKRDG